MVEMIEKVNNAINGFVWGPIMLILLVGTGIYLTFRTGWVQVRWFGYIMKNTIGSVFKKTDKKKDSNNLTPFQAMTTALAGTVGSLSGGEQSRLRLCMLMKSDINFLILDEPTNHLDIASREWIEQALDDYGGTLLFVSHDRWFTDRFATRVWELKTGVLTDFPGGYTEYEAYKARQAELTQIAKHHEPKAKATRPPREKDPAKRLAKVEREIEKLEAALADISAREEAAATDYQKLMELSEERAGVQEQLDGLYEEWEALAEG